MKQKTIEALQQAVEESGIFSVSDKTGMSIKNLVIKLKLPYKTFDDLEFRPHPYGEGVVSQIMFDNGYGASVVRHESSYGGQKGLYELAVLDKDGKLTYDTPITDDVVGYLSPEQVTEYLFRIQDLKN